MEAEASSSVYEEQPCFLNHGYGTGELIYQEGLPLAPVLRREAQQPYGQHDGYMHSVPGKKRGRAQDVLCSRPLKVHMESSSEGFRDYDRITAAHGSLPE